jgi:hypothetical protein
MMPAEVVVEGRCLSLGEADGALKAEPHRQGEKSASCA